MSDFFIPPPGLTFRLLGRRSNRVLVANPDDTLTDFEFGAKYPDQWFTLENAPVSGQYYIKSTNPKNHGKVIFCRAEEGQVGIFTKDYADQRFILEPGEGDYLGSFRIYAPSTNRVITAQPTSNTVRNFPADQDKYDDQYFTFQFEDTEIDRIEYDAEEARPFGTVAVPYPVELTNRSNASAKLNANMSQTVAETSSFEFHAGLTITVGAEFKTGIPFIAEGKVRTDVSASTDWTWGKTTTTESQVGSSVEIEVPPRSIQKVVGVYKRSTINLNATIYSKSKRTGVEVITKAVYRGTPVWGYNYTVQEAVPL